MAGAAAVKAGEAFVEIGGRDDALAKALKRSQSRLATFASKVKDLGKTFVKFGAIAVGAVGTTGFVKAIKAASEFEETLSKFNAVFKEQAKVTREWAKAFSMDVGRAEDEVLGFLASMQDTFVPLGFTRDAAAELSKQLTTLAVDVASFQNITDDEALRSFQSALVGNTESVRKFGIIISQSALKAELLNMGITKNIAKVTEQQKVMARFNIIMKSTKDAQGDAIKTAGSFANMMKRLNAAFRSLLVTVGTAFIPTMTKLVKKIVVATDNFVKWLKEGERLKKMVKTLGEVWSVTGKPIIFLIEKMLKGFSEINELLEKTANFLAGIDTAKLREQEANLEQARKLAELRAKKAAEDKNKAQEKMNAALAKAEKLRRRALAMDEAEAAFAKRRIEARERERDLLDMRNKERQKWVDMESKTEKERKTKEAEEKKTAALQARMRFQKASQALFGEPKKEKEKEKEEVSGGFGAFASRLLKQQIPRSLQTIGEKQLDVQKRTADAAVKMRALLKKIALASDPQLRADLFILKAQQQMKIQEVRGQQVISGSRLTEHFVGTQKEFLEAMFLQADLHKQVIEELKKMNQRERNELIEGNI